MAMVKLSIKPGRPGATHHGATRHAQQPEYGIFPLGAGQSTFKSDQYAIADADYPILRNLSYSEYAPELITDTFREFFDTPVETAQDVHKQLKRLRRVIAWTGNGKRLSPFIAGSRRQRVISFSSAALSVTQKSTPPKRSCKANRKSK